jgi:hypothetical protein
MAWVEDQGHRWPSCDGSYYDHSSQQTVVCGTGYETPSLHRLRSDLRRCSCQHCGMSFVDFSKALQRGEILACEGKLAEPEPERRVVDGIVIVGPEA